MSIVGQIAGAYRAPKVAMRNQIDVGIRDEQTLFYALLYGFLSFVSLLPPIAARAHLKGESLSALAATQFVASVFMMVLLMYAIGALAHLVLKRFSGQGSYLEARRAIFWAALVSVPLMMVTNATTGFIPSGIRSAIAVVTGVFFFWQWFSCLAESEFGNV